MRSISKRKNKKPIILIASAAVLVVGGGLAYLAFGRPFDNPVATDTATNNSPTSSDYAPPTEEELNAASEQKDEIIKATTGDNKTTNNGIVATITRASQAGAGQPLNIRVDVAGASQGTCEVTLTKDGQPTVYRTFSVVFEATSSRCDNADINASEFGQSGDWHLSLTIKSGESQSKEVTQVVSIVK